jgi:hypothetical protein
MTSRKTSASPRHRRRLQTQQILLSIVAVIVIAAFILSLVSP